MQEVHPESSGGSLSRECWKSTVLVILGLASLPRTFLHCRYVRKVECSILLILKLMIIHASAAIYYVHCVSNCILCLFQCDDFKMLGKLVATSIVQGGPGLPALLPAAYSYICKEEDYLTKLKEIPDPMVATLLGKVRTIIIMYFTTEV